MLLNYKISTDESLNFWGEEINGRHDFFVEANSLLNDIDILIFLDSRGISDKYETSLIKLLIDSVKDRLKYLVVGRPLEITTWVTLFNFLQLNKINPRTVITNMGFVDFTPKKESIVRLSAYQYNLFFKDSTPDIVFVGDFVNQENENIKLFVQQYPASFIKGLRNELEKSNFIIINTPTVSPAIRFKRIRPASFYESLHLTNKFNSFFNDVAKIIELPEFSSEETYDAVHYTKKGNNSIFKKLSPVL